MNIALRVPDSLGLNLKEFAKKENVSVNQLVVTAVAEKLATLQTYDYLQERAQKGSIAHLKQVLSKVPDAEPLPGDELT